MLGMVLTLMKSGALTFGGGMVIVALLEQDVVGTYAWLTHREFVDAIAMGQITPGPITISAVFIGYKVGGLVGSVAAMVSIVLPSFLMTVAATGQLQRLQTNPNLRAFLKGVTPAVMGMILAAGFSVAGSSVVDLRTGILALACLVALVCFKVDAALVVAAAGLWGLLLG